MRVKIKLFALARQLAGTDIIEVELPEPATIGQLREAVARQQPALATIARQAMFAVDTQYAGEETAISASHEIACIPPVSGG